MEDWIGIVLLVIPIVVIIGGVVIAAMGMHQHTKVLEMRHRERLAMIERGLTPAPEFDPAEFAMRSRRGGRPHRRHTSLGVALIAVGLGLMMIIGFAGGAPGAAIGVGGAIALLGVAFIVNAQLQREQEPSTHSAYPPRPGPSDPSGRVGP